MRRSSLAVALTVATLALAGCQSKEAKIESKQDQLKHLQDQWNAVQNVYLADCPLANMQTGEPNKSPHCKQVLAKSDSILSQMKVLNREIAAE